MTAGKPYKKGHYKMFHKGFTKEKGRGMTEGDVVERIGCIRVKVFRWDKDTLISTRNLREILGSCGYYMTEDNIRRMVAEGNLHGKKANPRFLYFPKSDLYRWVRYLERVGMRLLIERGIIKEEPAEEKINFSPKRIKTKLNIDKNLTS